MKKTLASCLAATGLAFVAMQPFQTVQAVGSGYGANACTPGPYGNCVVYQNTTVKKRKPNPSYYLGVNYEYWHWNKDMTGLGDSFGSSFVAAKVGANLNRYFALEGKLGLGIGDDSTNIEGIKVTLDPIFNLAAFGVGKLPLNRHLEVYGKAGVTRMHLDIKENIGGVSDKYNLKETKFSAGIGANLMFNPYQGINFELLAPSVADIGDLTSVSAGYTHYFW